MPQLLDEVSFERSAHRGNGNQTLALAAQSIDHRVLLAFVNDGADPVWGYVAFPRPEP